MSNALGNQSCNGGYLQLNNVLYVSRTVAQKSNLSFFGSQEQEQKAEEERIRMENILSGNPLLNLTGPAQPQANFKVKRR